MGWEGVGKRRYGIARIGRKAKKKGNGGMGWARHRMEEERDEAPGKVGAESIDGELRGRRRTGRGNRMRAGVSGELKWFSANARGWAECGRAEKRRGPAATHRLRARI